MKLTFAACIVFVPPNMHTPIPREEKLLQYIQKEFHSQLLITQAELRFIILMWLCIIFNAWCDKQEFHKWMCHFFLKKKAKNTSWGEGLSFWLLCIQPLIWMYEILSQSKCVVLHVALYIVDHLCMALNCLYDPYPKRRVKHPWAKLQS
jgi:hypothetical protein